MTGIATVEVSAEQEDIDIIAPKTVVAVEVAQVVIDVGVQGLQGAQGDAGNATPTIYFAYGDATPGILYTPTDDILIKSVTLIVLTAFNGTGATVSIGTTATPNLLMDTSDSSLATLGTYETSPGETIANGTPIRVFITPGAGASQGQCGVLLEYATA